MLSKGLLAVGLLCVSNIFMTCAWYLHLKLQTMKVINFSSWPIYTVVLFSWAIALFEYSFMVPANRIGFEGNGGPFSLVQLKIIQECITLTVFALFSVIVFRRCFPEPLRLEPLGRLRLLGNGCFLCFLQVAHCCALSRFSPLAR